MNRPQLRHAACAVSGWPAQLRSPWSRRCRSWLGAATGRLRARAKSLSGPTSGRGARRRRQRNGSLRGGAVGHPRTSTTQRVDYWIGRFQTDRRSDFETYLQRMGRYAPLISTELEKRDMPQDLVYLAMIESGFNPKAYSLGEGRPASGSSSAPPPRATGST